MRKKMALLGVCVIASTAMAGGLAYAITPSAQSPIDGNGAIHGCYSPKTGALILNVTGACPAKGDKDGKHSPPHLTWTS